MSKFNPEIKENIESIDIKLGNGHHGYVLDEKLGDSKLVSETKDNEENDIISSASCIVIIKLKNEEEPLEYIYESNKTIWGADDPDDIRRDGGLLAECGGKVCVRPNSPEYVPPGRMACRGA